MGSLGNNGNDRDRDGGVDTPRADQHDLDSYRQAAAQLDQLRIPVLLHADNPHERLYIAAPDGTGNSRVNDNPDNWSVVAKISQQIDALEKRGVKNIAGGYVEGTYTQEGLLRTPNRLLDGRFGHSFDERVETAYFDFCEQSKEWLEQDPQAQIRVAGVGFSRGSEEVTALQRMIEERGIRDPAEAKVVRDRDNVIQKIAYADKPLLVAPGKTLQTALLYDPVPTGVQDEDRRLPGSTLGTFQITAQDERRNLFPATNYVPEGFSEDRRNLNVTVGGSHSDIGDTYGRNGLGTLSYNLGVEFLNRLSDRPYLDKRALPDDPAQYVVHRSDQHMHGLYGTGNYDRDGLRDRSDDLSPQAGIQRKDPISPELDAQVERRGAPAPAMRRGRTQTDGQEPGQDRQPPPPGAETPNPWDQTQIGLRLNRMFDAAARDDWGEVKRAADEHARTPEFQQWDQWGQDNLRLQEQQQQQQQQEMQAQQIRGRSL